MNTLTTARNIHVIGIGGIGISAVARMLLLQGKRVTGSDRDQSKVTEELLKAGADIMLGHHSHNIPDNCDLVIYTNAIPKDNPELLEAGMRSIPLLSYPETLNLISKEKFTIAVSGTHGKTTTTAMIARVMIDAGLDPTVIVGSLMSFEKGGEMSNFRGGTSKPASTRKGEPPRGGYLVVEADEYKKSFHNLHPMILVVNNVDEDHLDFYKDLKDIQDSFRFLAEKVPAEGYVITDTENDHIKPVIYGLSSAIVDYKKEIDRVPALRIPGAHNVSNAAVAIAVGECLGIEHSKIQESLALFDGLWRRFEYKGVMKNGVSIYDDYAHNPQKVRALIQGAREKFPGKEITILFQPHLFSRTKLLFKEFVQSFDGVNDIVLVPIFPAREAYDPTISSDMLAEALRKRGLHTESFPDFESAERYLRNTLIDPSHVLFTLGAGEAYKIGEELLAE